MICPKCKKEIADNSISCANCGQSTSEPSPDGADPLRSKKSPADAKHSKQKKRRIKPLPVIAGIVLAAAVTMFCGFTFAKADFIRFFLGNKAYAAAYAKGVVSALADNGLTDSVLIYQLSSSLSSENERYEKYEQYIKDHPDSGLSYRDYENISLQNSLLSALEQLLPENGIHIKAGVKAEPEAKLYKLAAEVLNMDDEKTERAFQSLNSTTLEGNLSVKDDGPELSYLITQNQEELDSGNVFFSTKEGNLYYLNPSVYSSALRTGIPTLDPDAENQKDSIDKVKTEKERKALIKQLSDIYRKHLKNARTYYTDAVESAGNGEFKGKSMAVTFEKDALTDLFGDMTNAFYDSGYFNILLEAAFDGNIPDDISAEEMKKSAAEKLDELMSRADKLTVTLKFYINTDNSFAGLSLSSESVKGDDGYSARIKFINTKTDIYAEAAAGNNTYLKVTGTKKADNSGTVKISVDLPKNSERDEEQNLDIAIDYSDLGNKKAMGGSLPLGSLNVRVSGNLLEKLSLYSDSIDYGALVGKSDFTLSAKDKGSEIEYGFEIKNQVYGNAAVTLELGENTDPIFDRTGMNPNDAADTAADSSEALEGKIALLKHIRELCRKSGFLKICFGYALGKNYTDNIDKRIEELEKALGQRTFVS